MERIALGSSLCRLLDWCMKQAATDLHAQADRRYAFRVAGRLQRIPPEEFSVPTNDHIVAMLREAFSNSICDRIERQYEMDLSFLCDRLRYRANFSKQLRISAKSDTHFGKYSDTCFGLNSDTFRSGATPGPKA